jgi:hypothetical protein
VVVKISLDDLTRSFEAFWEEAGSASAEQLHQLWTDRYERRHQDLFELYYSDWANRTAVPAALDRFTLDAFRITDRARRLRLLLPTIAETTATTLDQPDSHLRFVLFVGVYASNAWVTDFRGRPVALFAVEQFPDAPHDAILIAHESAHQVHQLSRAGNWPETNNDLRLFEEGLAVLASEDVLPGIARVPTSGSRRGSTTGRTPVTRLGPRLARCF